MWKPTLSKIFARRNYLSLLVYFENKCQLCLFTPSCFYLKANFSGVLNIVLCNFTFSNTLKGFKLFSVFQLLNFQIQMVLELRWFEDFLTLLWCKSDMQYNTVLMLGSGSEPQLPATMTNICTYTVILFFTFSIVFNKLYEIFNTL